MGHEYYGPKYDTWSLICILQICDKLHSLMDIKSQKVIWKVQKFSKGSRLVLMERLASCKKSVSSAEPTEERTSKWRREIPWGGLIVIEHRHIHYVYGDRMCCDFFPVYGVADELSPSLTCVFKVSIDKEARATLTQGITLIPKTNRDLGDPSHS